jgi:RNA polymerase sigma-70 factor (ECF subfamily)
LTCCATNSQPVSLAAVRRERAGLVLAPGGKLSRALTFTFTNAKVTRAEVIGDPARLRELDIAVL